HPHFLELVHNLLSALAIPVQMTNRYALKTKGEMVTCYADQATLSAVAPLTVSCGKWKRTGLQCGRCVPCLIRRASFHAAAMVDRTPYDPSGQNLASVMA